MKHLFRKSYFATYETKCGIKGSLSLYTGIFDDPCDVHGFVTDYVADELNDDSIKFTITSLNRI